MSFRVMEAIVCFCTPGKALVSKIEGPRRKYSVMKPCERRFGQDRCSIMNSFGTRMSGRCFNHTLTYLQSSSLDDRVWMFSTKWRAANVVNVGIGPRKARVRTESAEADGICLGSSVKKSSSVAAPKVPRRPLGRAVYERDP